MRKALKVGFNCISVGARAYGREEADFARENGISVFEWKNEKAPAPSEIVDAITTDSVYVTLDIDGIDPAFMPATGTPVQGGLEWYYTLSSCAMFLRIKRSWAPISWRSLRGLETWQPNTGPRNCAIR